MFTWDFVKSVLYLVSIALSLVIAYGLIFGKMPSDLIVVFLISPFAVVIARIFANIFNRFRSQGAEKSRKAEGPDGR